MSRSILALVAVALIVSCAGTVAPPAAPSRVEVPLYDGLGPHVRKVTTNSPEAQRYFDQGLNFLYGFNHDEAIRAFEKAAKIDPSCAMAHWGIAYANGHHTSMATGPRSS